MRLCRKGLLAVVVWAAFSGGWAWAGGDAALRNSGDDPARGVDPCIGCSYNGHCFAAACVPFGMVQAGPDTGFLWWDYCSGYRYADTNILGFSQTHLSGTGCGDLGDLMLMPFTGAVDLTRTNFASAYRKETQVAEPGYYAVTLDDNRADVRIAAAPHAAIYEIGYRGTGAPQLFVDLQYGILNWSMKTPDGRVLACDVRQEGDRTLVGTLTTKVWVERTYSFALTFDRAITARRELPKRAATEKAPRFVLSFDLPAGEHEFSILSGRDDVSYYLPNLILTGDFGGDSPKGFAGRIIYSAEVEVPADAVGLAVDSGNAMTRIALGEADLGARGWAPFVWDVPETCRGRRMKLKVSVYTSVLPLFGEPQPGQDVWVPGDFERTDGSSDPGLKACRFVRGNGRAG